MKNSDTREQQYMTRVSRKSEDFEQNIYLSISSVDPFSHSDRQKEIKIYGRTVTMRKVQRHFNDSFLFDLDPNLLLRDSFLYQ